MNELAVFYIKSLLIHPPAQVPDEALMTWADIWPLFLVRSFSATPADQLHVAGSG